VVSTGQLAPLYGFTDTDGTRPDCWRYVVEVQDKASRQTITATDEPAFSHDHCGGGETVRPGY
jgi:hypothetical protein